MLVSRFMTSIVEYGVHELEVQTSLAALVKILKVKIR